MRTQDMKLPRCLARGVKHGGTDDRFASSVRRGEGTGVASERTDDTLRSSVLPQILIEEIQRALPGELRRLLVVAGRRIVVEAVLRAFVDEAFVRHVILLERGFIRR